MAISIGHFALDRDFKAFVCFRFDGSGILEVNEKRQAEKHKRGKIALQRYGTFIAFFYLSNEFEDRTGKKVFRSRFLKIVKRGKGKEKILSYYISVARLTIVSSNIQFF